MGPDACCSVLGGVEGTGRPGWDVCLFFRPNSTLSRWWPLPLTWPRCPRPQPSSGLGRVCRVCLQAGSGRGQWGGDLRDRTVKTVQAGGGPGGPGQARTQPGASAAMQDGNFLLSALQPEAGVCSLALPSDLQRPTSHLTQPRLPLSLSAGSRGQYHTLQAGFSSRSQGLGGDNTSTFRPIAKPAYSPASWSSRSAVDLSSSRRLSSAHNGGSTFGVAGYGGAQPAAPMPTRPISFHERGGVGSRVDYDTLSLRSLSPLPDVRGLDSYSGHRTLQRLSSGFDDIDLPSAVKYLMASDPNLQVLGAAYIQHKCYSDPAAKKQARSLQAVPRLVKLFNHANQEVQRHATGAMRNLVYDSADNKLALVEENGIFELLRTLREHDDELRKNVTGILWNLSSSDHLKDRLARDTLEQLTDLVLSPLSGAGGPPLIQQNASEAEIFYNATGFLRNLSSASQATRQKMRECHGLVDALVTYINHALDVGKCEDKSVENAVCVLRNLSYRLYDEMPPSALQRLEGRGRRDMAGAPPGEVVGCFTPQSRRLRELPLTADALTFAEVSKDPKGLEWLWSPQIVGLYNRLLQRCELNPHTTEAAAGALQNVTAGDRRWAGVLSRLALEQERILNPLLDRVRTADHHQLRSLTGLIRNLSRNARNKDEMSTKVVSHLIEKLPGSVGEKCPPADVLVNIIAVLNNLVVASPIAARDLLYFDGLRKLAPSPLQKGYRKEDFLGP
uniref:Plakophilin 3 n=1 Tax=Ursus maritimus TaxID=29073 RepID=A0A452TFW9_URSMA